jgi:dienelactone hydrolase
MAEIVLFHHAQGLTPGVLAFADRLRAGGHTVHAPDLFEGRTFGSVGEGVAHAREIGMDTVIDRGRAAAEELPPDLVYAGFSLGVMPAQALAQTRPGARGALLFEAFLPPAEFGGWPQGVPAQVHGKEADEFFAGDGDLAAAQAFVQSTPGAELFVYPGDAHLFSDETLPTYDAGSTALLVDRSLAFLSRVG